MNDIQVSTFHLLVAAAGRPGAGASQTPLPGWSSFPVPPGPSRLSDLLASSSDSAAASLALEPGDLWLEPVRCRSGASRLLLLAPPQEQLVVNERRPRRVALLKERDQFRWEDVTFHVTIFHRPRIGPPPPEKVGGECPLCRVPLRADTRCYVCACGAALHYEEDERSGLLCVTSLSVCPVCSRPIRLKEGYSYIPESCHE